MLYEVIIITLALVVLLIASFTDIKGREVPDWLSYGFIFAVIGIKLIFSIQDNWSLIISGLLGLLAGILIACILYYTHLWGGGDSKLLMGMGALVGINYPFNFSSLNLLWFFLALMLLGAIYGLIWIFGLAIYKRRLFIPEFTNQLYLYKKIHLVLGIISAILFIFFIYNSDKGYSFLWPMIPFPLLILYLIIFVSSVECSCFTKKIEVKQLTEGDWLAEDIIIDAQVAVKKKTLELEDLQKINQLHEQKKIHKVVIKEGIPFVPSFLFAYLFLTFGTQLTVKLIKSFL